MGDFYLKYIKYKVKYLELKNNINDNLQSGGGKKCKIDESDLVLFGDGGSTAIIIITKDKKVYKVFTLYNFIPDIELKKK